MTSIAFFVFNIYRYYVLNIHLTTQSLFSYLWNSKMILEQIFIPMGMLGIYWLSGYYNRPFSKSRLEELTVTLYSEAFATLLLYFLMLLHDSIGGKTFDYKLILTLFLTLSAFTYAGRTMITSATIRRIKKRKWIYSTLIVGNSVKSRRFYHKLKAAGSVWAYNVVGFIRLDREHQVNDDMPVWDWDNIHEVCRTHKVDQIIIATEKERDAVVMRILDSLFALNIPVKIAPDTLSFVTADIRLNDILGVPLIDLTSPRLSEFEKNLKRTFDVILSSILLLILSPVLLIIALIVKLSSKGPVFYRQERIGLRQKPFKIIKFRSMKVDAEKEGPQLSHENDPRITSFGRFMRKYRIDELPQFWNVVTGDMSLVGPRPERDHYITQITRIAPYYGLLFQVRPGITSWGMVKYGYASSIQEMVTRSRYDLLYINNMSLSTDLKILIYTIRTIVKGSGM